MKDEFDYDKVYLSKQTCVEKKKEEKNLLDLKREVDSIKGVFKVNIKDKKLNEITKEKEIPICSSLKVQYNNELQQAKRNSVDWNNNLPNNFKGLLAIKEIKSKRKILVNQVENSAERIQKNNDCKRVVECTNINSNLISQINQREITIQMNSNSEKKMKKYVISDNFRPFTAPEENTDIEVKKEIKSASILKKLASKIKSKASNLPSSRDSEKNKSIISSLTIIPNSNSNETINKYVSLGNNKISYSTSLKESKTGR